MTEVCDGVSELIRIKLLFLNLHTLVSGVSCYSIIGLTGLGYEPVDSTYLVGSIVPPGNLGT